MTTTIISKVTETEADILIRLTREVRDVNLTLSRDFEHGWLTLNLEVPTHWKTRDVKDLQVFCRTALQTIWFTQHGTALPPFNP